MAHLMVASISFLSTSCWLLSLLFLLVYSWNHSSTHLCNMELSCCEPGKSVGMSGFLIYTDIFCQPVAVLFCSSGVTDLLPLAHVLGHLSTQLGCFMPDRSIYYDGQWLWEMTVCSYSVWICSTPFLMHNNVFLQSSIYSWSHKCTH